MNRDYFSKLPKTNKVFHYGILLRCTHKIRPKILQYFVWFFSWSRIYESRIGPHIKNIFISFLWVNYLFITRKIFLIRVKYLVDARKDHVITINFEITISEIWRHIPEYLYNLWKSLENSFLERSASPLLVVKNLWANFT